MNYVFYGVDCESSGLDCYKNDIIELSLIRMSDDPSKDIQKTWFVKPINIENIELGALRVNGHKLEDLKLETKYGRDTYKDANSVIIEIENFLSEDGFPAENRFLVGQNVSFDKSMMEQMWKKCNAFDSFPFGRRTLDTMIIELFMDYSKNTFAEGYSLKNISKKYGVVNTKAHSAEADIKCTVDIVRKQAEYFKSLK
jgi:DNA polymerase III epsilon subunit-like protein